MTLGIETNGWLSSERMDGAGLGVGEDWRMETLWRIGWRLDRCTSSAPARQVPMHSAHSARTQQCAQALRRNLDPGRRGGAPSSQRQLTDQEGRCATSRGKRGSVRDLS